MSWGVVLAATSNRGKLLEFREILRAYGIVWQGLSDHPWLPTPAETGGTYAENSQIKARFYHRLTGMSVLADDSGLEVDALGGDPGVLSARHAGPGASDEDKIRKLLDEIELRRSPQPHRARFVCEATLVTPGGEWTARGVCEGAIATRPRGSGGFGYDPLFVPAGMGRTFAELSDEEKNAVSHRFSALRRLAETAFPHLSPPLSPGRL